MSTNFLSLPGELRNNIYKQLVVHQEPIDFCGGYELTPGLLLANKTIHREVSSLLYTQNCFDFTMSTSEHVVSFLEQIGRNNAASIRRIYIDFPTFHHLEPSDVTLEDDSVRVLARIQSDCTNLSTLTTSLPSTTAMELRLDTLDHHKVAVEALALVNTRFRAISSLQEIIVEVYEDGPSDHIRREMKSHGWTISATERVEELGSERSFGDTDYDDDWSYDEYTRDDSSNDDYDIDNDSDFWRRAGD